MYKMRIKKGDKIVVISGKDKGKTGEVTRVFPKENKVLVNGVNVYTDFNKKNEDGSRQPVKVSKPLHACKVALLSDKGPSKVGFKFREDGSKVRVLKKTGEIIE